MVTRKCESLRRKQRIRNGKKKETFFIVTITIVTLTLLTSVLAITIFDSHWVLMLLTITITTLV